MVQVKVSTTLVALVCHFSSLKQSITTQKWVLGKVPIQMLRY